MAMEGATRLIADTRTNLVCRRGEAKQLNVVFGFDAFIDQIADMVDKRQDFQNYEKLSTIQAFGEKVIGAAGLSTSIEYVPRYVKTGGSAVTTGLAMAKAGCMVTYIGCIGYPEVNPVFEEFAQAMTGFYTVGNPGQTIAAEFQDGKIMLCNTSPLQEITWERIVAAVGQDTLKDLVQSADLVATINWTMIPQMNDIWEHMQRELLAGTSPKNPKPIFFMDPTDPEKRTPADWREAMAIYSRFSSHYRTILSINRKEATEVARAYGITLSRPLAEAELREITEAVAAKLGLWGLVIHPVDGASAMIDGNYYYSPGPYTSRPLLTTGAGDNFNGGFCLGLLLGLTPTEALALGNATSGYYVRKAQSPNFDELVDFLALWEMNLGTEFA